MKLTYTVESFNTNSELKRRSIDVGTKKMNSKILPAVVKSFRSYYPDEEIIKVYLDRIEYTAEELIQ